VPGDKSISQRALILGALAAGETRISGLLESGDVESTAGALRALGAELTRLGPGAWQVRGVAGQWRQPAAPLDFGNSGTGSRLMMGAVATTPIAVTFTGDASLRSRPMARVLEPLTAFGARYEGQGADAGDLTRCEGCVRHRSARPDRFGPGEVGAAAGRPGRPRRKRHQPSRPDARPY
jgi:3-phosphoshikimate 1-carboxyvinyltransferase